MWEPNVVLYHAHCNDGFGAAWAISKKWPDASFIAVSHGDAPLYINNHDNVLIVDFSYPRDILVKMSSIVNSIVVLDHHKTAKEALSEFDDTAEDGSSVTAMELGRLLQDGTIDFDHLKNLNLPPIMAVFDMDRSGARMAWEFAHGDLRIPDLILHIEDRDLWQFGMHGTREIHAGLRLLPRTFDAWEEAAQDLFVVHGDGDTILRAERARLIEALDAAYTMSIAGHVVPACNLMLSFASDGAHELLTRNPSAPFAVVWQLIGNGQVQFSLRSEDRRADVSEIAKLFGGGGHRNAAGFKIVAADHPDFWSKL